jgi:DNA-binding LytR/AlgR family response regulator
MNCIIIEDQPPAQRILQKYIADTGTLTLKGTFSDALQAMEFLKSEKVDLIFLDIHLPRISGIDFLKSLPQPPPVILTTAFPNYALEGYELNVVDYLLKPFSFQRFVKAISKVPSVTGQPAGQREMEDKQQIRKEIFIKSGYEHIKITVDDILYIKSDADYTEIHIPGKKMLSQQSLSYWTEILVPSQFVRVHKSYIINSSKIEKIVGNRIHLSDQTVIPVGRAFKDGFTKRFIK